MSPSIDEEMAAARAADRNSRVGSLLQQASLDISGGLLNRDLGRAPTQPENNAGGLRAMREAAAKAALEARKVANESEALAQREKDRRENEAQQERFHADSMSSAKTAHEDAQENARAMRELAKGNQAIAGEHLKISKTELDDKQAAKATRDAALAVRVDGGEFKPRSTGIPDPVANDWRKTAGLYSSALVGMSDLEKSIRNYVANPGISTKNDMTSRLQAVASALNSANGGGAMSEAERRNVADALGADVVSPEGFAAVMMRIAGDDPTKAAKILLSKLNAARDTTRHQMVAKGDAAGFDFAPAGAPAPAAHPLDSEAVKWARSNPKDPRAAAILRANGVQ